MDTIKHAFSALIRTVGLGLFGLVVSATFFTAFFVHQAQAAEFASTQTGNWNVGTTWGGACASSCVAGTDYPGASDTATVTSTHTVTVPTSFTANFTSITVRGTSILKLTGQLNGGDLTIKTGATVQQDTTSVQTLTGTLSVESGGTLTHTANATTQAYAVNFTVGTATIAGTVSAKCEGVSRGNQFSNGWVWSRRNGVYRNRWRRSGIWREWGIWSHRGGSFIVWFVDGTDRCWFGRKLWWIWSSERWSWRRVH